MSRIVSSLVGCAALATTVVVAARGDTWWQVGAGLLALAVVVAVATEAGRAGALVAAVLAAAAAAVTGRGVWSDGRDTVARVLATNAPTVLECVAWLLTVAAAVTAVALVRTARRTAPASAPAITPDPPATAADDPATSPVAPADGASASDRAAVSGSAVSRPGTPGSRRVGGRAVAAGLAGAMVVGGAAWAGGALLHDARADHIRGASFESTTVPDADDTVDTLIDERLAGPRGPVTEQWRGGPGAYGSTTVAAPGTGLAVTHVVGEHAGGGPDDRRSGVIVRELRSGVERWRLTTSLWSSTTGAAVVSDLGRVVLGVANAAIVLDLGSGEEVARIALPEPTVPGNRYRMLGPDPVSGSAVGPAADARVVLAGHSVSFAAVSLGDPRDVVVVDLISDTATVVARGLPESCALRGLYATPGAPAVVSWIVRDGVGCGPPRVTRLLSGLPSAEHDVPGSDVDCELGCGLVDAFARGTDLVVQTDAEVVVLDYSSIESRVPATADVRAVIGSDGAVQLVPAGSPGWPRLPPGHRVEDDSIVLPSGAIAGPVPCLADAVRPTEPADGSAAPPAPLTVTVADGVLIASCGGDRAEWRVFGDDR